MNIGYDAKRAFLNRTGLGNYSRWLIGAMSSYHPENSYTLYTPEVRKNRYSTLINRFLNVKTVVPHSRLFSSFWRSRTIVSNLKKDGIALYHGLSHELPFGIFGSGIKTVVTVHDLIFLRYPQYFGLTNRAIYLLKLKYACKIADRIIAISHTTKNDLIKFLQADARKISVIYQGCDAIFQQTKTDIELNAIRNKYNLPAHYILSVGTIEARKNTIVLIKAIPLLDPAVSVVLVGRPTKYLNEIKALISLNRLQERVMFLHNVEFNDLPSVYQLAKQFIYPSLYEGFGIPILEALHSGVPVIAAKGSCLEEAGGPDSIYIEPDDEQELARQIKRVWNDKDLSRQMIKKGKIYAQKFDDQLLAGQLNNLYQEVINYA